MHARTLAAALLLVGGCDLVDETVVTELSGPSSALAVSMDGAVVWTTQGSGDLTLVPRDAQTGEVLNQIGPWTESWAIRSLYKSYEDGHEDEVWVMHHNGFRTRWGVDGIATDAEETLPNSQSPWGDRVFCDFARDLDGVTYLLIQEWYGKIMLVRDDGGDLTWAELSNPDGSTSMCGPMDFDLGAQQVAVQGWTSLGWKVLRWFDPDALTVEYEQTSQGFYGNDFRAFGHRTVDSGLGLRIFDESGQLSADSDFANGYGVDLHFANNVAQVWWSGQETPQSPNLLGHHDLQ